MLLLACKTWLCFGRKAHTGCARLLTGPSNFRCHHGESFSASQLLAPPRMLSQHGHTTCLGRLKLTTQRKDPAIFHIPDQCHSHFWIMRYNLWLARLALGFS